MLLKLVDFHFLTDGCSDKILQVLHNLSPKAYLANITTGVSVIFEEIMVLTRVRHIVSSKSVTVQTKM